MTITLRNAMKQQNTTDLGKQSGILCNLEIYVPSNCKIR